MFFEFSTLLRYVLPQKKKLSRSILSLISIFVIASIVWLVVVFLSVTSGIENKWLSKITTLHAPLSVYPNENYYDSYYYRVDSLAAKSNYRTKSLDEKLQTLCSDPISVDVDVEPPHHWPKPLNEKGELLDIAKTAQSIFASYSAELTDLTFDDFTSSGAQFFLDTPERLSYHASHNVPDKTLRGMALIQSFSSANKRLKETLMPLTSADFEHLWRGALKEEGPLSHTLQTIFTYARPTRARIHYISPSLLTLLAQNAPLPCYISKRSEKVAFILLPDSHHAYKGSDMLKGQLQLDNNTLVFVDAQQQKLAINSTTPCYSDTPITLEIHKARLPQTQRDLLLYETTAHFAGRSLPLTLLASECEVTDVEVCYEFDSLPEKLPPWTCFVKGLPYYPESKHYCAPLIAPKQWKQKGYLMGDKGHLSYFAATSSSAQEQQLPFYIAGFYDSGISAVASKSLMLPKPVVTAISDTVDDTFYSSFSSNGFSLFFDDHERTRQVTDDLKRAFKQAGIDSYFTFVPYYEYEFAKNLLEQFKSDRYLFSVISLIILLVATTNIISMLVVMVNDRKKELAILLSLGASKRSIASIFMGVGAIIGLISALAGLLLASITLNNLDSIISVLSYLQGHDIFNEVFYGKSLATSLSPSAMKLILIATPILSLIAGAIPALIACRVAPSPLLKAEAS